MKLILVQERGCPKIFQLKFNSLWSSDALWWHRTGSTLAKVMAYCLVASSHYLQTNVDFSSFCSIHLRAFSQGVCQAIILYTKFENYDFKITATSPWGQWVKKQMLNFMWALLACTNCLMSFCWLQMSWCQVDIRQSATIMLTYTGLWCLIDNITQHIYHINPTPFPVFLWCSTTKMLISSCWKMLYTNV